jgi:hypothetical protein
MASNRTGLTDADGDPSDWIELYNRGEQAINLAGWSLTDDPTQPDKWPLPEITLASREYLLVFASGKDRTSTLPGPELPPILSLAKPGNSWALPYFQDQFMDVVNGGRVSQEFPEQLDDISYGLAHGPTQRSRLTVIPDPHPQPNEEVPGGLAWSTSCTFSVERGFYETPFTLNWLPSHPARRFATPPMAVSQPKLAALSTPCP